MTLVTSETYVVGAMVLGYSLAQTGTSKRLICMVTAGLSSDSVASLRELYEVRAVAPLDSRDHRSLQLLGRPELGPTFTKIQLWALTDLHKAVFLDADMLVLRNMDDLFEREELSACADVGWPDCFNSGLFVCRPSAETHARLLALASAEGSFDGTAPAPPPLTRRRRSGPAECVLCVVGDGPVRAAHPVCVQRHVQRVLQLPARV